MTCFEQTASPAELESFRHSEQVIRQGKCKYCGAPAVGGSVMIQGSPGGRDKQTNLWCELCSRDLGEFAKRPENAIPDDFDAEDEARLEQISQQLAERERREQEYMRQKIKERGHHEAG